MKPTKRPALIALTLTLLASVFSAQPRHGERPAPPRNFSELLARTQLCEKSREHARQLTAELGSLLDLIPVEKIDHLEARGACIEVILRGEKPCRIEVPRQTRLVYDAKRGKLEKVVIDGRKLRLAPRLRFSFQDGEMELRKGDVAASWTFGWWDLDVRTVSRGERVVLDEHERPFVLQDAEGKPVKDEAGRYRLLKTERWLLLAAGGREMESPLPLDF